MATPAYLQKQTAVIPFLAGVDQKTAEEAVSPPKLLELENASFVEPGKIQKDHGYSAVSTNRIEGGTISTPIHRVIGDGRRQVVFGGRDFYERVDEEGEFVLRGADAVFGTTSAELLQELSSSSSTSYDLEYAYANGYEIMARASNTTITYVVRERATKTVVYAADLNKTTPGAGRHRAFAMGITLFLLWIDGSDLKAIRVLTELPLPTSLTPTTLISDVGAQKLFDAVPWGNAFFVAYHSGANVKIIRCDGDPSVTASGTVAGTPDSAIAVGAGDLGSSVLVAWSHSGSGLNLAGFNATTGAFQNTIVENAGATSAYRIAIGATSNAANAYLVYEDRSGSAILVRRRIVLFDGSGTVSSRLDLPGVQLWHKPILKDGAPYVGLMMSQGLGLLDRENAYCTVMLSSSTVTWIEPIAWYLYPSARADSGRNMVPGVSYDLDQDEYRMIGMERVPWGNTFQSEPTLLSLRFHDGSTVPIGDSIAFAGGAILGKNGLLDLAFPFAPVIQSVQSFAGAGGLVAGETYQYVAVFECTDYYGRVQRSIPSAPMAASVDPGHNSMEVVVTLPFMRLANAPKVHLYRTLGNQAATHHLLSVSTTATLRNAATAVFIDTESDAAIGSNIILYTDAGILENYPPPMGRCWTIHQDRIWCIDEQTGEIRFTRELVRGEGPGWHPNLTIDADTDAIIPKALVSSATGLWVFGLDKHSGHGAIGLIVGDGPNDAGIGGSYTLQRLDGVDLGTENCRTTVAIPGGILFEDPRLGIHLLPAGGGAPIPIGEPVEKLRKGYTTLGGFTWGSGPLVRAVKLEDRKEVRFVGRDRGMLVYHYDIGQWSFRRIVPANDFPFGPVPVVDSCVWNGLHVYATAFSIRRHDTLTYLDTHPLPGSTSAFMPLKISTGWIRLAEFSGLKRIWDLYVFGEVYETHELNVTIAYDFNEADSDLYTFSGTDISSMIPVLDARINLRRQMCTAIRITVEDATAAGATTGRGYGLVGARIHYGVHGRGSRKSSYAVRS